MGRRYPELADELGDLLSTVALMEDAKREGERTETDAGLPSQLNAWSAPPQLGDYRLVREIGRGGMGVVYEAEQVSLGRRVALKVLPAAAALDAKRLARFQREAQAVAGLHHTHIASVYGIGEAKGIHFIVMQYLPGYSLDIILAECDRLRHGFTVALQAATKNSPGDSSVTDVARSLWTGAAELEPHPGAGEPRAVPRDASENPPVPELAPTRIAEHAGTPYYRNVAGIGQQVAEALAYAHGQGMLHRDIKPSNLLVDVHGMVWLTDFGLAKRADVESLTESGDVLGTLRYMAPEAFRGTADARSDLYSLGLTLYEMTVLGPARSASQRDGLVEQVQRGTIPGLRKADPRIPLDLATIIHKAAAAEPAQRYQTATDLAADLARFLADRPIHARRVTLAERALRWARRNPAVSLATSVSALMILLTILIAFLWVNAAKNRALSVAEEKGRWAQENARLAARERHASQQARAALAREAQQRKQAQQNWQQAEAVRAEQEQTAKEARAVTDFLVLDMIRASQPGRHLGQEVTVRDVLDGASGRVGTAFPEQPRTEAAVRAALGQAYHALGSYDQSLEHLQTAHQLQVRLLGPEHLTTLQTALNLGVTLHALGMHAEEQQLEEKTLAVLQANYGTDHPTALEAAGNLAANLFSQGKHSQAQGLLEENLKRKMTALGPEHESTLATMSNLAHALREQGRPREGEALLRKVLAIRRRKGGDDHPDTLRALGNLAHNLDHQKRYAEAEPLHRQALAARRRVLGEEHSDTLATINNLAVNLGGQGRSQEAIQLLEQSLAAYRRLLGPKHPSTIAILNNVGAIRMELGDNAVATIQLAEAASAAEEVLGPTHPSTIEILNNLAQALANHAKFAEADVTFAKVLRARQGRLGPEHLQTAETLTALATIRGRLGRLPEAQELYEQALLVYRRLCGPDDPRTLLLQNQLAGTYLQQENYAQASVVFSEVLAGLRRQPDSDPANQVRVMVNLGAALAKQGEVGDAIRVYEELLALLPKTSAVEGFDASAIARLLEELRQGRTDMINLQPGGKP